MSKNYFALFAVILGFIFPLTSTAQSLEIRHLDRVTGKEIEALYSKELRTRLQKEVGNNPPLFLGPQLSFSDFNLNQEMENVLNLQLGKASAPFSDVVAAIPKYSKMKFKQCVVNGVVRNAVEEPSLDKKLCAFVDFETVLRRELEVRNAKRDFKNSQDFSLKTVLELWGAIDRTEFSDFGANDWYFIGAGKIASANPRVFEVRRAFGYESRFPEFSTGTDALVGFFGEKQHASPGFKKLLEYIENSESVRGIWYFGGSGPDHWVKTLFIFDKNNQVVVLELNYG